MHEPHYDDTADAADFTYGGQEHHGLDAHSTQEHESSYHGHAHDDSDGPHPDGFIAIQPEYVEVSGWEVPGGLAAHFDPSMNNEEIDGHPLEDMEHWHQQSYPDTCAVVSQEFILNELTGHHFTEEQLRHEALEYGLYSPGGTPPAAVGGLLELHGIAVEREYNASLDELKAELDAGHKVIVGVDADEIWYQQQDGHTPLSHASMLAGRGVNHAVQVIGYDPASQTVILNDPGSADGRGEMVPVDRFMNAWAEGSNFMVHTAGSGGSNVRLGGHYNADGTYYYESDRTDRDPQTGAIVHRY
jgi:hypothetical protein